MKCVVVVVVVVVVVGYFSMDSYQFQNNCLHLFYLSKYMISERKENIPLIDNLQWVPVKKLINQSDQGHTFVFCNYTEISTDEF